MTDLIFFLLIKIAITRAINFLISSRVKVKSKNGKNDR